MSKCLAFIYIILMMSVAHAQESNDNQINPLLVDRSFQHIQDPEVLRPFFEKLQKLESGELKTLSVVQIGDSHVQGPYFPQFIREGLQQQFGNAGRGFVFPYRVAETNGSIDVKFKATGAWKSVRNVKSDGNDDVGLSGINLETNDDDFLIEMTIEEEAGVAAELKIISQHPDRFKVSISDTADLLEKVRATTEYKVQAGDYLGKIAHKFDTNISAIQKANSLKSTRINIGQTLRIPLATESTKARVNASFTDLEGVDSRTYMIPPGITQLYIRPALKASKYVLDGVLLSNQQAGIEFHAVGVNGTKFSDYNKFPRFFDQLAELSPDLIIISLGTNESFYQPYSEEELRQDMDRFNREMINRNLTGSVVLTSPPPSIKDKRTPNARATAYAYEMGVFANLNAWSFYDLHSVSRTSEAMQDWFEAGLTAQDKIHFLKSGYQLQARLFVEALVNAYMQHQQ